MPVLKTHTLEQLQQKTVNAFFPRDLIIKKNADAWNDVALSSIEALNELIFQYRAYEFDVITSGNDVNATYTSAVDLSVIKTTLGYDVKKILYVAGGSVDTTFFDVFRTMLGAPGYSFNMIRDQDDFLDYIFSHEVYKQLTKRWQNRDTGYFRYGDKLLLDSSFLAVSKIIIFFLPQFVVDGSTTTWEFYDAESKFIHNYMEAETLYREGRALSEMNVMDINNNSSDYMSDGKQLKEETIASFRRNSFARIGKKF